MLFSNKNLTKIQSWAFVATIVISYILYFCIAIGVFLQAPEYLETLRNWVKIYVSLFLILRFNPFRHVQFGSLDRMIAFNAGVFLLLTTSLTQVLITYVHEIKQYMGLRS